MRLQSTVLALLGLVALGAVALQLLGGSLGVAEAATRIAVVLGLLLVVERVLLPIARALVGAERTPPDDGEAPMSSSDRGRD